ncbi:MAG TPA: hypothetical protein VGG25_10845 [Streptosporangiaceae bacterium]|jgi:hypothetical protein
MAAVLFTQVRSLPLYGSSATGDAGLPGYWAGYRPGSRAGFAGTATLAQTWTDIGGTYLFLAAAPADFAMFSAALTDWLPEFSPAARPRFVWLENPGDPAAYWRATGWLARGVAGGGTVTWTTFGVSALALGDYRLVVAAGATLTLNESAQARAVLAAGAATFSGPGASCGSPGESAIGFQGGAVGAWAGQLTVPADGLPALGVELRYAVRRSVNPADPRLIPVSMPVLGTAAAELRIAATWDPLNPTVRGRTGLRFAAPSPAIAASLVTQRGYATTLTPVAPPAAPWPGGLMFCGWATRINAGGGSHDRYSLAPDGAFSLAVTPPVGDAPDFADELLLGLSGLESAQVRASGTLVVFDAGRPAFAPHACPEGPIPGDGTTLLTNAATTAWACVVPATAGQPGLFYYAQPRQSPLFTGAGSAVLSFQEVPAARLASYQAGDQGWPAAFPVGAYCGVPGASAAAARVLEQAALAPLRRRLITGHLPGLARAAAGPGTQSGADADVLAITPRGLAVTLAPDLSAITGVVLASLPGSTELRLALGSAATDFEAALFSSQMFFVVSNPVTFQRQVSCVPPFAVNLDGWRFRLHPGQWRTGTAPTLMIWKYASRSVQELAADTAAWGWPEVARDAAGSLEPTRRALEAVISAARLAQRHDPGSPEARFYREVITDPAWNGVLFLNAPVDLADLPADLRFAAAGLDPGRVLAHHVGFSQTPFDPATVPITLETTSVFGLIDYRDAAGLVPESNAPFAFRTARLSVRFANARLADFAAEAELSLNRLFGAPLIKQDPVRGNNLVLTGALQRSGGAPSYTFALSGQDSYNVLNGALTGAEITSVRVETLTSPAPDRVTASFALGGKLRFFAPDGFDVFGYGPAPAPAEGQPPVDGWLAFSQLILALDFPVSDPARQTWTVSEAGIGFDLASSVARPDSLVSCFPVAARAIIASPDLSPAGQPPSGVSPEDLGYPSVVTPLGQTPMTPPWYGLVLTLDLGGLGALAGGAGLTAEILAAWMAGASPGDMPVYVGLKLPGTPTSGGEFPLQGVLRLGFRGVSFSTYQQDGQRAYLLQLSRLTLSALGLSIPPGRLDVSLFGGPQGRSTGQLGWLAAYTDSGADDSGDFRRLARERR